ncbi:molybdenum cofactor biosynthesis protein MoaB [Paenibacillus sp. JCM 10914]|uniref:MogA/MoaB family molybdenum cofactor biosynthesis protein n=1 Tax=Paenibacillus sp. JCM 10914 TaxID=1236974 RepID=UPI0003CC8CA9|nr:molybdenum cofactor biosynthesis protein B [Paenibacillus sp. JCM 10914]GAE04878.1 molybdenum cofactor biosynthesis protein MoaB [Paenibacillus sp. JCM 10914]
MHNPNSVEEHKQQAGASVQCMVITVSDTRTVHTDKSGPLMISLLEEAGHHITGYTIVRDDDQLIRDLITESAKKDNIDVVLLTGGTGISSRDTTYEAVSSLLDKELPGFGEIFRYLSFAEDIGTAAILSRAIGGTLKNTAIFSMPGSTGAVRLAMSRILLPELSHIKHELYKHQE